MPITPGIMQAAGMLNNLFNQGTNPAQSLQNVPNPEAVVSPEDPYQRAGYDPVLDEISTPGISGTDVPPVPPPPPGVYIEAVWNNYCLEFSGTNWQANNVERMTVVFTNGNANITYIGDFSGSAVSIRTKQTQSYTLTQGNKFYIAYFINTSLNRGYNFGVYGTSRTTQQQRMTANTDTIYSTIYTIPADASGTAYLYTAMKNGSGGDSGKTAVVGPPLMVNLTKMFGAGNEPTLAEFEAQCALNNIDLTQQQAYDLDGTAVQWRIE